MSHSDLTIAPLSFRVNYAIQELRNRQLSQLVCESNGSTVTLRGVTRSFYLKQVAQTVAMKTPGVERVENEIVVNYQ